MSKYSGFWEHIRQSGAASLTFTFDEIERISGVSLNHSFLSCKRELEGYGYRVKKISLKERIVMVEQLKKDTAVLYIHGKGGTAEEAEHYRPLFSDCDVIGLDYSSEMPWEAEAEFPILFRRLADPYNRVILIANSIGAYFAMCALPQERLCRAYFISPVTDMEAMIRGMMKRAGVTEAELRERGTVETPLGETLSWRYLYYAAEHPMSWSVPTDILYGKRDLLICEKTVSDFAEAHSATLTVMENGEHWFHTEEQMAFLDRWIERCGR